MENAPAPVTDILSSSLRRAVADRTEWRYDGNNVGSEVVVAWRLPERVGPSQRDEALRLLPRLRQRLAKASDGAMLEWLSRLGTLVAGQQPAMDEAIVKLRTYVRLLDYPAFCFTDDTLREAARRFTWMPSFAELSAFLDGIAAPEREMAERMQAISQAPVTVASRSTSTTWPEDDHERRRHWAQLVLTTPWKFNADAVRVAKELCTKNFWPEPIAETPPRGAFDPFTRRSYRYTPEESQRLFEEAQANAKRAAQPPKPAPSPPMRSFADIAKEVTGLGESPELPLEEPPP